MLQQHADKVWCALQVGQRRRKRRSQLQESMGTIPLERSLVPIRAVE